jgi:hypothetical protein
VKRKIKVSDLKKLIAESILEADDVKPSEELDDSLDDQVDRYLTQYESEAKSSKMEGLDFRMMTRRFLSEAEGDEEGGDVKDEKEPDDASLETPSKLTLEDIDVGSFANSVVRLIENYDSLLEVSSTLARRAMNFIAKSYEPDVLEALKQVLREEHGLVPGENAASVEAEDFPAPAADRAGPGGEGAASV